MLNLDSAAFRAWLAPLADAIPVGVTQNGFKCPVAAWQRTMPDAVDVFVSGEEIEVRYSDWSPDFPDYEIVPAEDWIMTFVDMADDLGPGVVITAGMARELITQAERLEGLVTA